MCERGTITVKGVTCILRSLQISCGRPRHIHVTPFTVIVPLSHNYIKQRQQQNYEDRMTCPLSIVGLHCRHVGGINNRNFAHIVFSNRS